MSNNKKINFDHLKDVSTEDLEEMKKVVESMSEEELNQIVGAGGDVEGEVTTTWGCVQISLAVSSALVTNAVFCK